MDFKRFKSSVFYRSSPSRVMKSIVFLSSIACLRGAALSFSLTAAVCSAQEPVVSTNGQTDTTTTGEEQAPPPPPPKDEFTLLAERLTDVKIPKSRLNRDLVNNDITDFSGKVLVKVSVDPATFPVYKVTSGDRLYNIAHKHYGSGHYGEYLAAYNEIDPSKLKIGQEIRMPGIDDAFNAAGLYPLMDQECSMILKARTDFIALEPELRALAGKPISTEVKEKLLACRKLVLDAMRALEREKTGVRESPQSVQVQLRSCAENLNRLAKGSYSTKQIASVHQRLGYAISYAIVWARNGYE